MSPVFSAQESGGPLISADELGTMGALAVPAKTKVKARKTRGLDLFGNHH
jgi:hypothetical protein